jgi:Protein of unknown function (DUF3617)
MTSTSNKRRAAQVAPIVGVFLAVACPANAEGLQPGLWRMTSTPEVRGVAAPPQVKTRCLTPEEASDVDKTFSPEHRTQNSACERIEHEVTGIRLRWRLQCTGQMSMDVTGTFDFDTPQHYTAVVTTTASIGGQNMNSRVTIEGERIGECP